ncbi:TRAP transporter permease [Bacillus sp. MRMR6]|uniref:TRAP transporter permease n=1 Tax=Bacillus sp. MRMR6 TaxID=1928617 RepID=UPI0009527C02|nr:TRAP transporter permease [Bacillus sp. MRMR6]OLS33864.1 hypothetical protein BTR25_23675 [Bacillus sp. MRMR6]
MSAERFAIKIIYILAIALSLFQLWVASNGLLTQYQLRGTHLGLVLVLVYLTMIHKSLQAEKTNWIRASIGLLGVIAVAWFSSYIVITDQQLFYNASNPSALEIFLGILSIIAILEATRFLMGWVLPLLAIIALAYAFLGPHLPSLFAHRGYSVERLVSTLYMGGEGIYGPPIAATATFVAIFVIFGSFLLHSGAGNIFVDIAFSLFGKVRGGPAKMSVVSSSFFGMVSGSPVANVVSTGTLSIPLMIKNGYKPHVAAAIEATSSTGGQLVPPVLGAAAFLMAEVTAIPYLEIVKASIIPALVFYFAIFIMVDFEAGKHGLKGLKKEELPRFKNVMMSGWNLLLPIAVLIYILVVAKMTPMSAAFWSIVSVIVFSFFQRATRMNWKMIKDALISGGENLMEVVSACATAGIIIGVLNLTGLGLKFSTILVSISGGHLFLLLVLAALASIVLGMGLPAVGVYLVLSVLVAPSLVELGVSVISAHFFIFYFGVLSSITPPIALAAYAAGGIAKADPMKTGFTAVKLAAAAYIFPFIFIMQPSLLTLDGSLLELGFDIITSLIGTFAIAIALQGYPLKGRFVVIKRLIAFALSICLIIPNGIISLIGLLILIILLAPNLKNIIKFGRLTSMKRGA